MTTIISLVSALSNYNFEKPFLWLARKLRNNINLQFVPWWGITPPEVVITAELAAALAADQEAALNNDYSDLECQDDY